MKAVIHGIWKMAIFPRCVAKAMIFEDNGLILDAARSCRCDAAGRAAGGLLLWMS
jgi:hypothetical protein